ncbi:ABC transporter permease [Candidatus Bipolaricaulota bacterium]|nr:ABC transporter permease [Candidatus Bipolaricaulota bacterium]
MGSWTRGSAMSKDLLRRLLRSKNALLGLVVILSVSLVAICAPFFSPHDPYEQHLLERLKPPSLEHPLGTDAHGRDLLSRIFFGARISLMVGFISVGIGLGIGVPLGLAAGYGGRWWDDVIMRIIDIMMAFPGVLLALVVVAILGPGLFNVMIAVGVWSVPMFARMVRASVLRLREEDFVQAARAMGCGSFRVALRHLLPNCIAPILVLASLRMATAILSAATLSFLGLGAQPPTPDWGAMLSEGRKYLRTAWWFATFPGLAIMLTVLGFNLLGDGLRDALDPRLRGVL